MMTLNEIKLAIRNGNFSNEDLITLGSYIQNVKTEQAKASISVGDEVFVDDTHGSPYDRGGADSYYGRAKEPHFYPQGTYNGKRVEEFEMTQEQIDAYNRGYDENESAGNFKDWG